MIQANELRIGNWIEDCNGNYMQVDGLLIMQIEDKERTYPNSICPLPIPLTPEILESCGCWQSDLANSFYKDGLNIKMNNETAVIRKSCTDYTLVELKYLHQLQNLYFALTGEEIKINLNVAAIQ